MLWSRESSSRNRCRQSQCLRSGGQVARTQKRGRSSASTGVRVSTTAYCRIGRHDLQKQKSGGTVWTGWRSKSRVQRVNRGHQALYCCVRRAQHIHRNEDCAVKLLPTPNAVAYVSATNKGYLEDAVKFGRQFLLAFSRGCTTPRRLTRRHADGVSEQLTDVDDLQHIYDTHVQRSN